MLWHIFDVDRLIAAFVILHYDMRNRIRLQFRCIIRPMRVLYCKFAV